MRRESSRLRQHARALNTAIGDLAGREGADGNTTTDNPETTDTPDTTDTTDATDTADTSDAADMMTAMTASLTALLATAADLDEAGAALQRYATDLAEGHELGRRAQRRVEGTGLVLEGTRVVEPWGPATAEEAERRRALVPEIQSRVDLATAHVGRARGRLERNLAHLTEGLSARSLDARSAAGTPVRSRKA
jgi:hypothetical protein